MAEKIIDVLVNFWNMTIHSLTFPGILLRNNKLMTDLALAHWKY